MTLNRKQRRALKKVSPAVDQLGQAVQELQKAGGLEHFMELMKEVQQQSQEMHRILMALLDDYQVLADQHEATREVLLEVISIHHPTPLGKEGTVARLQGAIDERVREIQQARAESAEQGA